MIKMGIPQCLMVILYILGLGIHLANDGKIKIEYYSFWKILLANTIQLGLLYWGGFFR